MAPTVTLVSPADNSSWTSSSTVVFTYNVSDLGDTIVNCSLYINGTLNASNQSAIVQDQSLTIAVTLEDASYNWSVHCFDDGNLEGNSSTWKVSVKFNYPPNAPTLNYPPNESIDMLKIDIPKKVQSGFSEDSFGDFFKRFK